MEQDNGSTVVYIMLGNGLNPISQNVARFQATSNSRLYYANPVTMCQDSMYSILIIDDAAVDG